MKYTLQQNAHQGSEPVEIELPDSWEVQYYGLPCDQHLPLTKEEIRQKINQPFASPRIAELAKTAKHVCIVFDDITRGTPIQPLAEIVVEELLDAGIKPGNIELICALGTHGAQNREDHVKKLGADIVNRFAVYNHNCYDNTVCVGYTTRGVPATVNAEFMKCDLRIGLGGITPHTMNAFGGGGKLIFPGIAGIDTIAHNHETATSYIQEHKLNSSALMGNLALRGMREEIEEMIRMVGQFFKIDCLYNSKLEIVDVYAGDAIDEYYAAIPAAQACYGIDKPEEQDVVIVNANAKATEATIATGFAAMGLKRSGGDVVLIDHTNRGQTTHFLFGSFGHRTGGKMMGAMPTVRPEVERYICWMPHPDLGAAHWFGETEKQIYLKTWEEVMQLLLEKHGPQTKAAIIADGTLSFYKPDIGNKD